MDMRSMKEAGSISRFVHILILAVVVAPGIANRSQTLVAALTAAWFVLFAGVYLFVKPRRH